MNKLAVNASIWSAMVCGMAGAWLGVSLGGCFHPSFQDGQFQCGPGAQCPPGFRCDPARGVCVDESAPVADAAVADTAAPDADPLGGRAAGAVLLYLFDEGQGDTIHDRSGLEPALDLTIQYPDLVDWGAGAGTLALAEENRIWRSTPPERLIRAVQASNELTAEAWLQPAQVTVNGPRRILTLSQDNTFQSLLLGQGGDTPEQSAATYLLRMRTSDYPNDYDTSPVKTGSGTVTLGLTHLVFARESGGRVRMYINGEQVVEDDHPGSFSVWAVDTRHLLGLGNEQNGGRQWMGVLHLIALYDRALDESEIAANYEAGPDPEVQR